MRNRLLIAAGGLLIVGMAAGAILWLGGGALPGRPPPSEPLIVVDAGHGGRDPGAVHAGVREADLVLQIANRLSVLLQRDPRLRVSMTRATDVFVSLEDRMLFANESQAAVYVSLHANTFHDPQVQGVESLVSDAHPVGSPSWQFAEILQRSVIESTQARDRGVRHQDLYIHRAQMPAVLLEMGFLTHPQELARLLDPFYQQLLAESIYEGIVTYLHFVDPSFPPSAEE